MNNIKLKTENIYIIVKILYELGYKLYDHEEECLDDIMLKLKNELSNLKFEYLLIYFPKRFNYQFEILRCNNDVISISDNIFLRKYKMKLL